MKAALKGSYVEFVLFAGITEKYPLWFEKELGETIYMDESRYTFWVSREERNPEYHEKQLIEDYSVFLRKDTGEVHVTDYDVFSDLYTAFAFNIFTNSGLAALGEDCIEYVECHPGVLPREHPHWFYEYFTECDNLPPGPFDGETLLHSKDGEVSVDTHCVFLRNRLGEIRGMEYDAFLKHYDPKGDGEWSIMQSYMKY